MLLPNRSADRFGNPYYYFQKKCGLKISPQKTGLWDKDMSRDRLAAGQLDKLWLEDNTFI